MKQLLLSLILLFSFGFSQSQSVFNPADPVINYVSTDPTGPTNPQVQFTYNIVKWVRTPKMSWDASRYKCYLIGNVPFRLRFPNSYQPGVNDGKKYPIMLFFHGGGEANAEIHDNEFQLYNGGQTFGNKIDAGGQDAFVLFPQSKTVGWGDTYFVPMNIVIDSLIKNCKGDPDRVLSMGLSIGGAAAIDYAIEYPQRASSIITSSPVYMRSYASSMGPAVHLPIWLGNGGIDTNPLPDDVNYFESQYNTNLGGYLTRSFYPALGHVMWDPMWAEEPRYNNAITNAHKANPLIFFNKKLYCPGATVSSRLGITQGFAQYQWDKNGVEIPGAISNEYIATDFGTYRVHFKRTASSNWSDWSPIPAVISPICPPVAGNGTGLKGTYYSNVNLTPPSSVTRTDATVNFTWNGSTSPVSPLPATNFSVRWTGKIQPQFSETYTIYTNSDDGIRLWINGVQVINNFTDHGPTDNSGTITLVANQKYDIKIEYYNSAGSGSAVLSWSSLSQAKQLVPTSQLYPDGTGDPDLPLCATNTSPTNGSTIAAGTSVALNWNSVFNAASYDVYVWTGATPPSSPTASVTSNTYTATGLITSSTYNWYVVPKNITGSATGCGTNNKTTFITPAGVPVCATNISPVNTTTIVTPTSAALSWGAVSNATSYDVYIWSGATPPASAITTVTAPTVSYTATSLAPGTLYSWYVIPKNAIGPAVNCNVSAKSTFTTGIIVPVPSCTTNSTPVNGATVGTQVTADLAWTVAANATSYDVFVYTGTTIPSSPTATVNAPAVTYTATGLTAGATYNWFVVPKNATGSATGCSGNATSFATAPLAPLCTTNLLPANNATLIPTTTTLSWTAAPTATSYDVYLYTGTTIPGSPTATVSGVTTYTTTAILAYSTTYNWFVVPKNAGGSPANCSGNATSFITVPPPAPSCTPNVTPAVNAVSVPITATFTWTAAANATAYDIYVYTGTVAPGSPTATVTGVTTYTTTTNLAYATSYNWFVVPKNTTGSASGCSSNATAFTTIPLPAPSCTPNVTPAVNAVSVPITATLTWTATANATAYDIYVYTGTVVPGSPTATVTGVTTYTTTTNLAYATSYNWFVVPKNTTGSATGCSSNATAFTTIPVPAPVCTPNLTPAVNATLIPITATLTWTAAANATAYDVYVYTGTVVPGSPTATVTGVTTFTTANLAYSTTYNWFVVPKNTTGSATGCSSNATAFTTIPVPTPSCTPNLAPAINATLVPITATFTWTAAANATSYDVFIYAGTTVPTLPTATVNGVTTYTTTTNLAYATSYNWFVVPRNTSGPATGCAGNATSFTTIPIPAPTCTPNLGPAANATLVPTTAILTWTAAANATAYDVYVYTGTVVPGVPTATVTGVTTFTTAILDNATTYNWFVVPKNATGSATGCSGNATSFTTIAVPAPSCTPNLAPALNATLVPITATFTWTAAANATAYDIYVYTGTVVPGSPTATVTGVTTYTTTTSLAYSTAYNWFVVPKNTTGSATGCSANATSFTTIPVPVPLCTTNVTPVNNATLVPTAITLTWTAAANATSYDVFLWTGGIVPSTPVATVSGVSYDASGLAANSIYNWYVVPKNTTGSATGCGTSNKFIFTTAPTPPPLCTPNVSPAINALLTTPTTATLTWTAAANADSYDVYLWTGTTAPSTPVATVTTPNYNATGLVASSLYNWYVVPKNTGGSASGCAGNATSFTTAVDIPACTTTASPVSGTAIGTPTSANLTWTASPGATSYDIYVYTGATIPSSATGTVLAPALTYNATGLTALTTYNWFVVPKNITGAAANCDISFKSTFTTSAIAAPICATNLSPANGNPIGSQTTITLTWGTVPTATSYDVYLWPGGVAPTSPFANVPGGSFSTSSLTAGTTYTWYIVPKNASGGAAGCAGTNAWTFTTQAAAVTPPGCATNPTPASGTLLATQTSALLAWTTVNTASSYDVYLWSGPTPPTSATITVGVNSYNPTNLAPATTYSWYIVPRNTGGPAVGCSGNVLTFTTAAIPVPVCAVNSLPVSGTTILTQNTASLAWGNIPDATSYDVYIWTGLTVPTTATATVATNTYPATGLIANTTYNWYVVPKNASGPATGCDLNNKSTFITAQIPAPTCTTNSSPIGGIAIVTPTSAPLVWATAPNATSYDVYIWTGTTVPTTATTTVTTNSYTATGLIANSTYNWYVVPKNATGSATGCAGNASTFVTAPTPAPSCTPNVSPANSATLVPTIATLTWTAAANATAYDVYVYTGTVVPGSPTATVTGVTTYTTAALAYSTAYNWFVVPKNTTGGATGCSANATSFTTVTVPVPSCTPNVSPAINATLVPITATLTWTAAANATAYDIYVYTGTVVPGSPTATVTGVTTFTTATLANSTSYNWFVVPKNTSGSATGCSGNATSFTTIPAPVPSCTPNLTPLANATQVPITATLTWTATPTATSYDIYIYTGVTVPTLPTATVSGVTTYTTTINLANSTTYNWFVVPRNASGPATGCSANATAFTTAAIPAPSCTANITPAVNATLVPITATLTWTAAANATAYDIYVYTGTVVPGSPTATVTGVTTFTTAALGYSTNYNWFVVPKNASGSATGCSGNATAFTTAAIPVPSCTANLTPAANATLVPITATLIWTAAANATAYDVYVYTGTVVPGSPMATVTGVTTYTTAALANSTTYNWFVVPKNTTGSATGCSGNATAFTTAAIPAPSCTTGLTPAANATLVPITAVLTWTAAANATAYDVYVYSGTVVPGSPTATVTGVTTYTTATLAYSTSYNWFVVPKNASGSATGCSANAIAFTTIPVPLPSCTTNLTPGNNTSLGAPTTATLTWTAAANATAYDIYVYTGTVVPGSPTATVTGLTTYTATGLTASTVYNWFVVPKNTTGSATGCSSNKFAFTTAANVAGTGLQGTYYNGITLTGTPLLTRVDPTVNFDIGNGSPAPGTVPVDLYSVRWTGQVKAVYSETYTFYTEADDGIRLWVNSVQLVNNWVDQGTTERSGTIAMVAGQKYDIIVEYYENAGGAVSQLLWSSPSTAKAIVPQTQLYPTGIVTPVIISCAINTAPATGSTLTTSTGATLTWGAIAGATSYDVYVYTGATAPASPTGNTTTTTYIATGLTGASTYNWFVIPKNAAGSAAGCGTISKSTFITANVTATDGTGLQGAYYNGVALAGVPLLTRIDPTIDFDLGNGSPAPGTVPVDLFSVRWTGQVKAVYSETYTFYTNADDGIRLWVNGVQLVNNWVDQGPTEKSGSIVLVAGQKYDIVVEYYESAGGAIAQLKWSSASTPKAIVPQTQLYPPGTVAVPSCTTNLAPANNATLVPITATLTWTAAATATSYDVYVYTGTVVPTSPTATVTGATTYATAALAYSTAYNWFVIPGNAGGPAAGCSGNATTFTTIPVPVPSCTTNLTPTNAATLGTPTTATLTWAAAVNATAYDVYVYTGTVVPGSPTATVTGVTTYTVGSLTASTTYNWFVVPKNTTGSPSGCSSNKFTFTTAAAGATLGTGLQGTYYNGITLTGTPLLTRIDPTIDFDLGNGSPAPGTVPVDLYSVRWTGQVKAVFSETYTFYTLADDGIRLWVNGVQLVNNWVDQGTTERSGTISMVAGQKYDIIIEYYESAGGAFTQLQWSSPSTPRVTVPQSQLYPTGIVTPVIISCAVNTSPATGSTLATSTAATVSWNAIAGAVSYDVYVYTGATPPASPTGNTTATTYIATGLTAASTYNWFVIPKNAAGSAAGCGTINRSTFITANATATDGTGLQGAYYNGITLTGTPLLTRIDPTIDFDLGNGSPAPGTVPVDLFSVRWTGQVKAVYSETYTFYTTADDGIRLWVNGTQLVNNWVDQGPTEKSGTIVLVAGQKYDIVVEYYENAYGAIAQLRWSSASTPKAIIPQTQLYPPAGTGNLVANAVAATTDVAARVSSVPVITSSVSPNPVKPGQSARLQINSDKTGTAVISIVNSNGFVISTQKVNLVAGVNTTSINTSMLGQGFYIVNITGGDKPVNVKLLVE